MVVSRKMKYLGVNLTKESKDLYKDNYSALKREIKKDFRKQVDVPCSLVDRINIVKMAILTKVLYRFSVISIKCQQHSS